MLLSNMSRTGGFLYGKSLLLLTFGFFICRQSSWSSPSAVGLTQVLTICPSQVNVDNMTRNSCIPHLSFNNDDDHCCELGVPSDCSRRLQPDSPRRLHTLSVVVWAHLASVAKHTRAEFVGADRGIWIS